MNSLKIDNAYSTSVPFGEISPDNIHATAAECKCGKRTLIVSHPPTDLVRVQIFVKCAGDGCQRWVVVMVPIP